MSFAGAGGQFVIFSTTDKEDSAVTVEGLGSILRHENLKNLKNVAGFLVLDTGDDFKADSDVKIMKIARAIKSAKLSGDAIDIELVSKNMGSAQNDADLKGVFDI